MPDFTRAYQKAGDFTQLEISEKEYHDKSVELIREQIGLIKDQKEYSKTINRATTWTAIATVVMALAMLVQLWLMISAPKPNTQPEVLNTQPLQQQKK